MSRRYDTLAEDLRHVIARLDAWAPQRGDDGIRRYWHEKNRLSLDGRPTGILEND